MAFDGVHLFPVRHHSPRAARALRSLLDTVKPQRVLVEAPQDAEALLPLLTDPESAPPIAILGYRTDGEPQSAMWPFASYSPEYVALAWARRENAVARLIDWPTGIALAADRADLDSARAGGGLPPTGETTEPPSEQPDDLPVCAREALAAHFGARSFEEFWEAWFEAPDYDAVHFAAALDGFAEYLAQHDGRADLRIRQRDAWMARAIQ
ncbi:MAG TPA: DUF5682 family protein, partial [Xanthomonadales bacterium]|nr:DUF5682 family protein [Xanthomonadales bacterium]